MRQLSGCLLVLVCGVIVLGLGSILPRVVFAGEGVGAYSGEKEAFARFALVYDLNLREWPFPIDPTVARRVTEVSGTRDRDSPCTSEEGPRKGPYYTGYFAGDYRAEVVHYGPFFVPTGKNVFNCDIASTYFFLLPRDAGGVTLDVLGLVVLVGAFGLAVGTVFVPVFLTVGGGILLIGGTGRRRRSVGLVALLLGLTLVFAVLLRMVLVSI